MHTAIGNLLNPTEDGVIREARFVIFAIDESLAAPENDLANILGYPMDFHLWTGGIQGPGDSFDNNPSGEPGPGHIIESVNSFDESHVSVIPFGNTGPADNPTLFTTFLVTVDLSSFNIQLNAEQQYVMSIIQFNQDNFITGGGNFRISGSLATGPEEDLFRQDDSVLFPGSIQSQLGLPFSQYGAYLSIEAVPEPSSFTLLAAGMLLAAGSLRRRRVVPGTQ